MKRESMAVLLLAGIITAMTTVAFLAVALIMML